MRVMVVDDEPEVRRALRSLLERAGYEVLEAATPIEAIDVTSRERYEAALLDWSLGTSMTGVDVAKAIRRMRPSISTIIVSGHSREEMRAGWRDPLEGIVAFHNKPIDSEALLRTLRVIYDSILPTGH